MAAEAAAMNAVACCVVLALLPLVSLSPTAYHSGHLASGHVAVCDPDKIPDKSIICYVRPGDPHFELSALDPCLCTHIVYGTLEVHQDLSLGPFVHENLTALGLLQHQNPHLVPMVEVRGLDQVMYVPDDQQLETLSHKIWTTIEPTHPGGVDIDYQFHGIDHQVAMEQRHVLANFVQHLRQEIPLKSPVLSVTVAKEPHRIEHVYDFPTLAQRVDYVNIPTFMFHDDSPQYAVHPAPLHGDRGEMDNTDSLVNLVLSMGVPPQKVVVGVPMFGVTYRLADPGSGATLGAPLDVHGEDRSYVFNHPEFCALQHNLNFSVLRDQDLTAPYAVSGDAFFGFEDDMSLRLKGKYIQVRDLGGAYAYSINDDDAHDVCGQGNFPLLHSLHEGIAGISSSIEYLETDDDARIVRIVDHNGDELHVDGLNSYSVAGFTCTRQGFYRHPADCTRFYRCVKFDQRVPDYTVFLFNCPAGLVFDDRIEVCNWPSWSQSCHGSGEILSTPKTTFRCPGIGYYQDPENCRWFYFCDDVYENGTLTPFDLRCPHGLGFDPTTFKCNYRSITPGCADYNGVVQQALFGPSLYAPGEYYHAADGNKERVIVPPGGIPVAPYQHGAIPQPVGLHGVPLADIEEDGFITGASDVSEYQVESPLSAGGTLKGRKRSARGETRRARQIYYQDYYPQAVFESGSVAGQLHDLHVHETHIQTPTQAQYQSRSQLVPSTGNVHPEVLIQPGATKTTLIHPGFHVPTQHVVQVSPPALQTQLAAVHVQQQRAVPVQSSVAQPHLPVQAQSPTLQSQLDTLRAQAQTAVLQSQLAVQGVQRDGVASGFSFQRGTSLQQVEVTPQVIPPLYQQHVEHASSVGTVVQNVQQPYADPQTTASLDGYVAQGVASRQAAAVPQVLAHQPQTFLYRFHDVNNHMRYSPGMSLYGGYAGTYERRQDTLSEPAYQYYGLVSNVNPPSGLAAQQPHVPSSVESQGGLVNQPTYLPGQEVAYQPRPLVRRLEEYVHPVSYNPSSGHYEAELYTRTPVRGSTQQPQPVAYQPETFLYGLRNVNNHMRYSPGMSLYGGYAGIYERQPVVTYGAEAYSRQQPAVHLQQDSSGLQAHPAVSGHVHPTVQHAQANPTVPVRHVPHVVYHQGAPAHVQRVPQAPSVRVHQVPQAAQPQAPPVHVHQVPQAAQPQVPRQQVPQYVYPQSPAVHAQPARNTGSSQDSGSEGGLRKQLFAVPAGRTQTSYVQPAVRTAIVLPVGSQTPNVRPAVPGPTYPQQGQGSLTRQPKELLYKHTADTGDVSQQSSSLPAASPNRNEVTATKPRSFLFQFKDPNKFMRVGPGTMVYGGYAGTYEKPVLPPPVRFDYSSLGHVLKSPTSLNDPYKPRFLIPPQDQISTNILKDPKPLPPLEPLIPVEEQNKATAEAQQPKPAEDKAFAEQPPTGQNRPVADFGGVQFDDDVGLGFGTRLTKPQAPIPKETPSTPPATPVSIPDTSYGQFFPIQTVNPGVLPGHDSNAYSAHKYTQNHLVAEERDPVVSAVKPELDEDVPEQRPVPQSILGELSLVLTRMRPNKAHAPIVTPLHDILQEAEGVAEKLIAPDNDNNTLSGSHAQASTLVPITLAPPGQDLQTLVAIDMGTGIMLAVDGEGSAVANKDAAIHTDNSLDKPKKTASTSDASSAFLKSKKLVKTIEETSTFPPETLKHFAAKKMRIPKDRAIPEAACTRAGLFRHPHKCGAFYECYFDKWLNKFTVHEFDCPIKLAFDESVSACSSQGFEKFCRS
ncbi:uncharacterized protein LOC135391990 [Ornithodoros turicata]|uniref:uncharacterized protein LOC135391990 n=1 Tax=Ornithodoros turicata TaxID=34597 RepID=UPI003139118E